jgi:hypothetical protein
LTLDSGLDKIPIVDSKDLTPLIFFQNYVQRSLPVVIKNAIKDWKLQPKQWTNNWLRQKIGTKRVQVEIADDSTTSF